MQNRIVLVHIFIFNVLILTIYAYNHWQLKENGKILPKIDSPFYLREPSNLMKFLDQIEHNEYVETTYMQLLRQREQMVDQITYSTQFGVKVIENPKCSIDEKELDSSFYFTKITKKYLNRISLKKKYQLYYEDSVLPLCWDYIRRVAVGICCFDHIENIVRNEKLHMEPEEDLRKAELEFTTSEFLHSIIAGLENSPDSWKYYTLASYYWRMRGEVGQALDCARFAVQLAPRKFKDIPLLSMGSALFMANQLKDAEIVLSAAVDHAPDIPENQLALATTLAMLNDFNRSTVHFEKAEQLDPINKAKTKTIKQFVKCLDELDKVVTKMYTYADYIKEELNILKQMKQQITKSHEKLIQQQVPLATRHYDITPSTNQELLHRGQYCTTRTSTDGKEPTLFCDFYSELQMRLESNDVDIDSLERDINANSEVIRNRMSGEFRAGVRDKRKQSKKN